MQNVPASIGDRHHRCLEAASGTGNPRRRRTAFTLVELLVVLAIIAILLTISGLTWRRFSESSVLAQARNAVLTYAEVARSYAVAHRIETMMLVNPRNGRFEIWHLNPPAQGGPWDPLSETHPDGYVFAPVLDTSARLPLDSNGEPAAVVCPIDYEQRPGSSSDMERDMDAFRWPAFCFDQDGQLVIRTRRVATRTYYYPNGAPRPNPNRLRNGSPDRSLLLSGGLVMGGATGDTPITSTRGFVISDFAKMKTVIDTRTVTSQELVDNWLMLTRPGERYAGFASTVVMSRFSGGQLAADK